MSRGRNIGDKPITNPAEFIRERENLAVKGDGWGERRAGRIHLDRGSPVDQFGLGNGEVDLPGMGNSLYGAEGSLVRTRIGAVRKGGGSKSKIINIREDQAVGRAICKGETLITNNRGEMGEPWGVPMETGGKNPKGALEEEAAGPAREEGLDPGHEVVSDAFGAEGLAEDVGIHVVKLTLDV